MLLRSTCAPFSFSSAEQLPVSLARTDIVSFDRHAGLKPRYAAETGPLGGRAGSRWAESGPPWVPHSRWAVRTPSEVVDEAPRVTTRWFLTAYGGASRHRNPVGRIQKGLDAVQLYAVLDLARSS